MTMTQQQGQEQSNRRFYQAINIIVRVLQNILWIGALSNIQGQMLEAFRGMIEPMINGLPIIHTLVNIFIGSVVPAESAPSINASARAMYLGLRESIGDEWAKYLSISTANVLTGIFSMNGVGKRFQPGLILDLANIINTTTGYYFGKTLIPLGRIIFNLLGWLIISYPLMAIILIGLYIVYSVYCNVSIFISIITVPVKILKMLF